MIIEIDKENLFQAAIIHSESWKASHRSFCASDFIELHTPERQLKYLSDKISRGSHLYMLVEDRPIGIVSVTGNLIEDLYVIPNKQNMGYGTKLLQYAVDKCTDTPTLWILENNKDAERLYQRMGFQKTGRINKVSEGLDEIEFALA